jgi:hypothetical protein
MKQMDVALDPMAGTMPSLAARGRSSRAKGQKFERTVANMLTESTGVSWRRRVRQHACDSDVVADDPAFQHIAIECKHAHTLCLPKWWRQAQKQAGANIPVLIYRKDGGSIYVQVDAHHVSPTTWPVLGRHTLTLGWDSAMQWLREKVKPAEYVEGSLLGE